MQEKLQRIISRIQNFSWLEIVGTIAIGILVLNSLFAVSLNVKVVRKPPLHKILGTSSQTTNQLPTAKTDVLSQEEQVNIIPTEGVELPVVWGDYGKRMAEAGVIDKAKMEGLYSQRGGMTELMGKMMNEDINGKMRITPQNSGELLNLLWALGLGNKNEILDKGEMQGPQYGGAGKFASTAGWTLAQGNAMDHYSKHSFIKLLPDQQAMVDRVSKGIFRPCCGNSTHFPDCNHGMAMLGLLQLMASQNVSEQDMYKSALAVNAYWFPDTYLTIASFLKTQGKDYAQASSQELLSAQYSSGQGYRQILNQVQPAQGKSNGGCGV